MSVKAKAPVSQSANILAIEIAIYPANFLSGGLFGNANGALCAAWGLEIDDVELHR
jgi:hypothetical protein